MPKTYFSYQCTVTLTFYLMIRKSIGHLLNTKENLGGGGGVHDDR